MPPEAEQQKDWLVQTYFNRDDQVVRLDEGDILMRQGRPNERLYYVRSGSLWGYDDELSPDGQPIEKLSSGTGDFVGIHSFFSLEHVGRFTVRAKTVSVLSYITTDQPVISQADCRSLAEQFMPVVIVGMVYRQELSHELARQQEKVMSQVSEVERLAALGQLSAGVAHELNNVLAVLLRGSRVLSQTLPGAMQEIGDTPRRYFELGRDRGRALSSKEMRSRRDELQQQFKFDETLAERIATMCLDDELIEQDHSVLAQQGAQLQQLWEMGATLRDMEAAARHAEHVITSMKALGVKPEPLHQPLSVNDTVLDAVALLQSKLRLVQIDLELTAERHIRGSRGSLVQIWVNLLKNAVEACQDAHIDAPAVLIRSLDRREHVGVELIDNGPGITADLLPQIFQPNVTTKKKGLSFGLGLGLTIVQRLVRQHHGEVSVSSRTGRTVFAVTFPAADVQPHSNTSSEAAINHE